MSAWTSAGEILTNAVAYGIETNFENRHCNADAACMNYETESDNIIIVSLG